MKRRIFLLTGLVVGFLFFKILVVGAIVGGVTLNEVCSYSTNDWVEVWNHSDTAVDMSNWEVRDLKGNKLATTTILAPDGYVVLGKYQIFDNGGDTINLFNLEISSTTAVESFNYGDELSQAPKDAGWHYAKLFSGEWSTTTYFTTGTANVFGAVITTTPEVVVSTPASAVAQTPTSTQTSTPTTTLDSLVAPDYSFWQNIKLNEIVSAPLVGENEKVELFNASTTVFDLTGGFICDDKSPTTTSSCKPIVGYISSTGHLVVDLGVHSYLNNDSGGDTVYLKNPKGEVVNYVNYSNENVPDNNESLARFPDGQNDWKITTKITLGAANIIVARIISPSPSSGGPSSYTPTIITVATSTIAPVTTTILINEIFPDPTGVDDEEFLELFNFGTSAVDLGGWKIKDKEKTYNLSSNISAGGYVVIKREDTDIALNNTTAESVILVDAWGREVDKISYERARTGESYNRTAGGWLWSSAITPGAKNVIEEEDAVGVIWKITAPESGEVGEKLKFSAIGSVDPRGGQLNFIWKFASGTIFAGPMVEFSFTTSGIYDVLLFASSSAGTNGDKRLSVKIGAGLSVQNTAVGITEIFPNPAGDDSSEYIEIFNFGTSTINLGGWNLRVDMKSYEIPVKTNIAPNSILVFYRAATKMALNNSGGKVSLLTPAGDTVDFIKYDKAISGKSFSLEKNIWQWAAPSPGVVVSMSPPAIGTTPKILVSYRGGEAEGAGAILGVKISNTTVSAKSSGWYVPISITDARTKPKDAKVKVRGVVSTLPGIFGSQYFYISSPEGNGIQIYQNKKYFPELKIGDEVEVSGAMSEASGQKRVRAGSAKDIKILGAGKIITPIDIGLDELDESLLGGLVKITGDITEIKSNYMYVDNGAGEVEVFFKTGAKIDKVQFKEGDKVEVVGVLENVKNDFQIWPRSPEDIKVVDIAPEVAGVKIAAPGRMRTYILTIASAVGALGLGWLLRERGKVVELLKKIFKA